MNTEKVRSELARLENEYPDQLLIIRSSDELNRAFDTRGYEILNGESHFFKNNDPFGDIIRTLDTALTAGRQASVQAAGNDNVLVMIAKPGKMLFRPKQEYGFSPSSPSFSGAKSPISTNSGMSILAAIATFILSILFIGAVGGRGIFGYCCLPTILAVVAYFVTPTVIQLASKENGRKFLNIGEDILTFFKSHFDRKDVLENKLDLSAESDKDQEK